MKGDSADAPSATIEATAAEVAEEEDAGTNATIARSGATILVRTASRTCLVRAMLPLEHCVGFPLKRKG